MSLINENYIPIFPRLNLNYLKNLRIDAYQIHLAPSYIQNKFRRDKNVILELDKFNDSGFVRIRINSRARF